MAVRKPYYPLCQLLCFVSYIFISTASSGIPQVSRPYYPNIYTKLGQDVRIPCPINDATFVNWYKDKEAVLESSAIRIKSGGEFDLTIRSARHEDHGIYSCEAVNGNGPHPWLNFTLHVLNLDSTIPTLESQSLIRPGEVAPTFSEYPPGQQVQQLEPGAGPKLRCKAEGIPRPHIEWYKDGRIIRQSESALFDGFSLKLQNLQSGDDGKYMCRVYNNLGAINFTYIIGLIDRQSIAEVIPPYPLNTSVTYGTPASLQCRVKSQTKPTIRWLRQVHSQREGSTTINNKHFIIIRDEASVDEPEPGTYVNTLYIPSVQQEDAGMYVCTAINQRGGSDMRSAFIKVVSGPGVTTNLSTESKVQESSWEYIFGSPSATLAVLISIPVVLILIITIAVIYGFNKRKKNKGMRRPPASMINDLEAAAPLNKNTNNACLNGHFNGKMMLPNSEPYYTEKMYPASPYNTHIPQQYSHYSQSDGSYRSAVLYPHANPNGYVPDIPDTDSQFSSVSHTKPQYMNNVRSYDRDIQSDPPLSRLGHHHCPPAPPGSYYSGQW